MWWGTLEADSAQAAQGHLMDCFKSQADADKAAADFLEIARAVDTVARMAPAKRRWMARMLRAMAELFDTGDGGIAPKRPILPVRYLGQDSLPS